VGIDRVVPGLYRVTPIPGVNVYLLEADGLTLIDTAVPGSAPRILAAVERIGRRPSDIRRIVVTHCHPDHYGSLAALKRETGAPAIMHPVDAAEVRRGTTGRAMSFRGPFRVFNRVFQRPPQLEPAEVEQEVGDGQELPGGLRAIHVPGHCDGQIALHWPERGILVAADTAWTVTGLTMLPFYVDVEEGRRSLAKLAALDFEVACFGHGRPIRSGASARIRQKWAARAAA
jgi:glyoxylase-like metal-dependent hydrolase (beta-lactamase superfamily II)